ncbi:MAG: cell division/cell wall cluster transcriptional repressor MraZ [Leifsonia sp.]|nr:cell division/cell wall cluster transcriptional repressor MraZ [Leifsonia sp.]|tara:strand:- start:49672 stop:50106 length:435 start_codon:yes stop_codon:yes gene_type:complete
MLLGTFVPKLDDKGRLVLPAKFWDEFAGGLVMTRGQEGCVYVYSQREFEALHERMSAQAPALGKKGRDYLRLFLSGAAQEIPDSQRRITIPAALREYAHLDRELTVIGAGTRAEIWDTEAWNTYYSATEAEFSDADGEVIAGLF